MATVVARAARNQEARERLDTALSAVAARLDVAMPPPTRRMQDRDLQPIVEVERFADIVEAILGVLARDEQPSGDYDALTVQRLKDEIVQRGLELPADTHKANLIAVLESDDGS